jgi:guanylate kinase
LIFAFQVHENYYGRSALGVQTVVASGKLCIIEVDIQGAETFHKANIGAHFLFVNPPSFEELAQRLSGR